MPEFEETESLCPVCLARIPARRVFYEEEVRLEKQCPAHGDFSSVIWRGPPNFEDWKRPKLPSQPPFCHTAVRAGCPFDCGLCPAHDQHTCTTLLEVTWRCNLGCPVCFAQSGDRPPAPDPSLDAIAARIAHIRKTAGACTLQISGGEPTVRDDLPEIVRLAAAHDFSLLQLNTNGLRFAREPGYADKLREAGLESVFLQFDAVRDEAYPLLRGRPLWPEKQEAVRALVRAGLGLVLVPTLVPGINTRDIGDIVAFALDHHPGVRGVHFQPVSYFGRYPAPPADADRITLPEVMRAVSEQTRGKINGDIRVADFRPPGCEHALCSFHAAYRVTEEGELKRQGGGCGCCAAAPVEAAAGARQSVSVTARRWRGPLIEKSGAAFMAESAKQPGVSAAAAGDDLDRFLAAAQKESFTVSAMAFQDVWTLDLERLRGCCIHVLAPDHKPAGESGGRLIPFCAYNLTAAGGEPLYRQIHARKAAEGASEETCG